jgi:hypothetical protein
VEVWHVLLAAVLAWLLALAWAWVEVWIHYRRKDRHGRQS